MKNKNLLGILVLIAASSCSPMRSSAHDERHLWELTLHEVKTNLDDLRHDVSCFKAEMQILEERLKYEETAIASLKEAQAEIGKLSQQIASLEKKGQRGEDVQKLLAHANETTIALTQFKERIRELEGELLANAPRAKSHKVKSGDSLEKIAKLHNTSVEKVKKLNRLESDRILPGQELALPNE